MGWRLGSGVDRFDGTDARDSKIAGNRQASILATLPWGSPLPGSAAARSAIGIGLKTLK